MQQWQVGPVPDLTYFNNANHQNDLQRFSAAPHQYPPTADVNRRNDRMEFPYAQPQPGSHPHAAAPGQAPMSVPQGPSQPPAPPSSAQQPPASVAVPVSAAAVPVSVSAAAPQQPQQSSPVQVQPHAASTTVVAPIAAPPAPAQQASRNRKRPAPGAGPGSVPQTPSSVNVSPSTAVSSGTVQANGSSQDFKKGSGSKKATPTSSSVTDASTTAASQPPAKKSRTNTPWTPTEELRLKQMRDAGNSWAEIAKTFPTRTEGSVKKHWYKDMHYAEFAEDESQALLNAIKEYENNKWKAIGQKVGKPAKACEQYAKEHFPETIAPKTSR